MTLEDSGSLDGVFHALADPTRRAMLRSLASGQRNIGELAAPFRMSFAAASKHVRVLEAAGLVRRKVEGRSHVCRIEPSPLAAADEWLRFYERLWTERLDALDALLKAEDAAETLRQERRSIMSGETPNFVRVTRRFDASPERVFDAWLNPETARKWLFASPSDELYSAEIEARVGGAWTITARRGGKDYTGVGEYLEIDRPHRLVFTFAMPQFSPDFDRIIVEIVPDGAGCVLTLTQENLPPGYESATEEGWGKMFDALAAAL